MVDTNGVGGVPRRGNAEESVPSSRRARASEEVNRSTEETTEPQSRSAEEAVVNETRASAAEEREPVRDPEAASALAEQIKRDVTEESNRDEALAAQNPEPARVEELLRT